MNLNKQKYGNNFRFKKGDKQVNRQQQHCKDYINKYTNNNKQLAKIYRDFAKAKIF